MIYKINLTKYKVIIAIYKDIEFPLIIPLKLLK